MANTRFDLIKVRALESMYRNGYENMTLRQLARDVGIQTPSLYNYISSKQELLYLLMKSIMEELIAETRQAMSSDDLPAEERLRRAVWAFARYNAAHPHEAAVSDAEFRALTPENRVRIVQLRDEFQSLYLPLIHEAMASGGFVPSDPRVITNTILSACARIYVWYRADGPCNPEDLADIVSAYLMRGLTRMPEDSSKTMVRR
ncbi:MAG: TetR family transcriptional regulator [Chloroflexota bacterium]|nr:MAG: hypothetical protein DLM70_05535 [Chloroflexota bacterium]